MEELIGSIVTAVLAGWAAWKAHRSERFTRPNGTIKSLPEMMSVIETKVDRVDDRLDHWSAWAADHDEEHGKPWRPRSSDGGDDN